jgi:PPP family 3-phenylpropionic acid transporter
MGLFAAFRAPLLSLVDASALDCAHRRGSSYGRLRAWGSVGFVVAVLGGGALVDGYGPTRVMLGCTLGLAAATAAAWVLPAPPVETRSELWKIWRGLLADRSLWLFLAAVATVQTAHSAYDACFSLHLRRLGFDGRFIGGAWAVGVLAEVVLLAFSGRLFARVPAERLLSFAAATGAARWLALAGARSKMLILVLQPLHAISFGLTYVTAVTIVRQRGRLAPTAAQGLFATAWLLGSVVGMSFSGTLLEQIGGAGLYTVAAGVALVATGFAVAYERAASAA